MRHIDANHLNPGFTSVVQRWMTPRNLIWAAVIFCVLVVNLYPILWLFVGSIRNEGKFTLEHYRELLFTVEFRQVLWNTFVYGIGSTFLAIVSGVTMAWLVTRTDIPCKRFITVCASITYISPPWLLAIAYMLLLSPNAGVINVLFFQLFGVKPFTPFSMTSMIFVTGLFYSSLVFIIIKSSLENMDSILEQAAIVAGSNVIHTTMKITLPLITPSIITCSIITFVRAWALFAVPAIMGLPAKIYVFSTELYLLLFDVPPKLGLSAAVAVAFSLISLAFFIGLAKFVTARAESKYSVITGKPGRKIILKLGRAKHIFLIPTIFFIILSLILPFSFIIYLSFTKVWTRGLLLGNLTLENYTIVLFDPFSHFWLAFKNSMVLASLSSLGTVAIAIVVGYITVKSKMRFRNLLNGISTTTLAIPVAAFTIGVVWAWIHPPIVLYGTLTILVLAHMGRFLPLGVQTIGDAFKQLDNSLEEAGITCGGSWLHNFFNVIIPLLRSSIIAVFLLTFMTSLRDIASAMFLFSPSSITLPVLAYQAWLEARVGETAAMATILLVIIFLLYLGLNKFSVRRE